MRALVTVPGVPHSAHVADVPAARAGEGRILLQPLEVGICGTDREIAEGLFGFAPDGEERLILGHELVARVHREGNGFARGDLVTATVRRSCGACAACLGGASDSCATGRYRERGVAGLHGFASDLVAEAPDHVVALPPSLGRLGVLAEPASICERGLRHARAIGGRQPWSAERALVLGAGAIGMLSTYFLRLAGVEVWTADRAPLGTEKAELVARSGATYVSVAETHVSDLRDEADGFDIVIEAAGDAQAMLDAIAMLRRNGVACLIGIDGRPRRLSVEGRTFGIDMVAQNRAVFGTINAHTVDWQSAVEHLDQARARWPGELEQFVGRRVELDRFADAFGYQGVKATVLLAGG
jgi:threonine dehydrogenase-like Zn-dependent dehydrogenase